MADVINTAGSDRHRGFARAKKLYTRVDLTPMVDLGFLLITFFILTYHFSEPNTMKLFVPADGSGMEWPETSALTVIPAADDKIFYYHGEFEQAISKGAFGFTGYSITEGVGRIIREKQAAMERVQAGKSKDLMLIIKPSQASNFANLVNTLDEVLINNIRRYAIVDISQAELGILNAQ